MRARVIAELADVFCQNSCVFSAADRRAMGLCVFDPIGAGFILFGITRISLQDDDGMGMSAQGLFGGGSRFT